MIRFGPAGIPLSCKGRTLVDGVEDIYALGLNTMELQLVRMNDLTRHPMEEEVGLPLRELTSDLVLQIIRGTKVISDPDEKVKEGDQLVAMISGPACNYKELAYAKSLAKKLDITLSIHSPYYMDLTSEGEEGEQSIRILQWAGIIAKELDADPVVTHVGLYEGRAPAEAYAIAKKNLKAVTDWYRKNGINARIGIEMSGRQEVFGTMDEVLSLCKDVEGIMPVVNLPHLHARGAGSLLEKNDFLAIFEKTAKYVRGPHYVHFSGVEHQDGNEMRYTPIKKGDLRFEPMAEALIQELYNMTLISGSPLLEHDAMYMRVIFERNFAKTVSKAAADAYDEDEEVRGPAKKSSKGKPAPKGGPVKGKSAKPSPKATTSSKGKAPAKAKGSAKAKPAVKGKSAAAKKAAPKPVQKKGTAKAKPAVKGKSAAAKKTTPMPKAKSVIKKAPPKKVSSKAAPNVKKAAKPVKRPAPKPAKKAMKPAAKAKKPAGSAVARKQVMKASSKKTKPAAAKKSKPAKKPVKRR